MDLDQYLEKMNTNTKIIWIQEEASSSNLFFLISSSFFRFLFFFKIENNLQGSTHISENMHI